MDLEAPMASLQLDEPRSEPQPEPPAEPPQESRRSLRLKYNLSRKVPFEAPQESPRLYNLSKKVQHEPFYFKKRVKKQSPSLETIDEDREVDYNKRKDCVKTLKKLSSDQFLWNKRIPKKEKIRRILMWQEKVPDGF